MNDGKVVVNDTLIVAFSEYTLSVIKSETDRSEL
jgi:hypothetical protein